jgi:hypothetical protein
MNFNNSLTVKAYDEYLKQIEIASKTISVTEINQQVKLTAELIQQSSLNNELISLKQANKQSSLIINQFKQMNVSTNNEILKELKLKLNNLTAAAAAAAAADNNNEQNQMMKPNMDLIDEQIQTFKTVQNISQFYSNVLE